MAYPHYQVAVPFLTSGGDAVMSANSTAADVGWFYAGPRQVVVSSFGVQRTATAGWATGAVFRFTKVCGKYAGTTGNQIAQITMATAGQREDGLYFNNSFTPTKIPAGYGITVKMKTASTGKLFRAWAVIEPSPERLQNFSTGYFRSVTN